MQEPRMLYIYSGTMGFSSDPRRNALWYLSNYLTGDFVCIWCPDAPDPLERFRSFENSLGSFQFHYRIGCDPADTARIFDPAFYVTKGLMLSRQKGKYDAIVTYGLYKTGLAGTILKRLFRIPLIVEVPGNPRRVLDFGAGLKNAAKRSIGPRVVKNVLRTADHIRLLYPEQVTGLAPADTPRSVFHNFVPISLVPDSPQTENFILFTGFPWNLKGVDILIRAFQRISANFPEIELRIVGYCADRSPYERLAGGNPRIRFFEPVANELALEWVSRSRFFVLPSRTEAMGRVLLEAMAARRAIVASDVDGIPHYVHHGVNGLLFPMEDDAALAERMASLLSDPAMATRLGEEGYRRVNALYSEQRYAEEFASMVRQSIEAAKGQDRTS